MPILIEACILALLPASTSALNISLGPAHYAASMENYYKAPKPELLAPMLRSFADAGILANAEKRMFVAAFLAALARKGSLDLKKYARETAAFDNGARATLAWSMRLAGKDNKTIQALLPQGDKYLIAQIQKSPARIEDWDPASGKSALDMHWAAFMATGANIWLDRIIAAACAAAHMPGQNNPAASLYDYAPAHPAVIARLKARLASADLPQRQMIETILAGAR